jgi:site-specific recombinase XerD
MKALKLVEQNFQVHPEFLYNFSSEFTRKSYLNDLTKFTLWLQEYASKIKSFVEIERLHIIQYRNYLHEFEKSAPKTISRKLSALSSYFDFLVEKNLMDFNPATSVKRPRREVITPTKALNAVQVKELLAEAKSHPSSGPLHYALLSTFFYTGLRKSEILNLKFKDYTLYNGQRILSYQGKGGKRGQKLLHPNCIEAIDAYLDWMNSCERSHLKDDFLFQPTKNPANPKNLNKALNPRTMNEIMESYAKKIHLDFHISPHSARATFIGELLNAGVDIYSIALEVNHSSVTTTQEYDKRRQKLEDSVCLKLKI